MINIYVSIHTGTHQSITNALFAKGWGRASDVKAIGSVREKERNGLLSFLKGCEQVATPSALQPQRRNSGAPSFLSSGCS